MLYLKACPKCHMGAIKAVEEWNGEYFVCLNCGYTLEVPANGITPHNGGSGSTTEGEEVAA